MHCPATLSHRHTNQCQKECVSESRQWSGPCGHTPYHGSEREMLGPAWEMHCPVVPALHLSQQSRHKGLFHAHKNDWQESMKEMMELPGILWWPWPWVCG